MKLFLALLILPFTALQTDLGKSPAPTAHEIVVDVGYVPMNGLWFQDEIAHIHDKVKIKQAVRPDGSVEVTLGTGGQSGTDLTLTFVHDGSGATRVSAVAVERTDVHRPGAPNIWHISDIDGRVMIHTNDWGPGKDISCMFALHGMSEKQPVMLMGSFLVVLPEK
jgi:hypothetical protein